MFSTGQLLGFALASLVLIVIPGPGVLFVVGRALAHGRRTALATALGHAAGNYVVAAFVAVGADGVQLSNHGGRQLDRTVPPVSTIAAVRDTVGPDVAVLVDSGIRHGSDMAVALALGADACAIGRAYLYGLMAGGEAGVNKALDILDEQFKRTKQLLGVRSVAELREAGRELLIDGK